MLVDLAKPFDLQLASTVGLNSDNSSPFLPFISHLFLMLRQTTRERGFYPDKEESKILRRAIIS